MSSAKVNGRRGKAAADEQFRVLAEAFPLRPIRSRAEYDRAGAIIDRLAVKGEENLGEGEADYLHTLSLLVSEYDETHSRIDKGEVPPLEMLKFLMAEHAMKAADLGRLLGSSGLATEILKGRREMSKRHVAILAEHFGVGAGVFIERVRRAG